MFKKSGKKSNLKVVVATSLVWMFVLSATAVFANTDAISAVRSAVNVRVNGQLVEFTPETAPINFEGRNFLPVATLGEALGVNVFWHGETQTIYLGARPGVPTALPTAAPAWDASAFSTAGASLINANSGVRFYETAVLNGQTFADVLSFVNWGAVGGGFEWSEHLLGGYYTRLTGYIGRQQGSNPHAIEFRFYTDGVRIEQFVIEPGDGLVNIDLDMTGVNNLRIETRNPQNSGAAGRIYGFAATLQ